MLGAALVALPSTAVPAAPPAAVPAAGATDRAPSSARTVLGADISLPNCPKGEGIPSRRSKGEPFPKPTAQFVQVGVTNGPGFTPNPCLAGELAWVATHHRLLGAYALTTKPRPSQVRRYGTDGPYRHTSAAGRLRNAGYAEAAYNVSTMNALAMVAPMVWVDVEPYAVAPWSHHHSVNRDVLTGVIRGYREAGFTVGIYTYARGWHQIVGAWHLPKLPTWSPVGPRGEHRARAVCHRGPSGGRTWIAQWTGPHRDFDLLCPAAPANPARLFHLPTGV
jgi:hypothetical protein